MVLRRLEDLVEQGGPVVLGRDPGQVGPDGLADVADLVTGLALGRGIGGEEHAAARGIAAERQDRRTVDHVAQPLDPLSLGDESLEQVADLDRRAVPRVIATTSRRRDSDAGARSIRPSSIKAPRVEDASRRIAADRASAGVRSASPQRARARRGPRPDGRCAPRRDPLLRAGHPGDPVVDHPDRAHVDLDPSPRGASGRPRAWRPGNRAPNATGSPGAMIRAPAIWNVPWIGRTSTVRVSASGTSNPRAMFAEPPALNWWQCEQFV